MKLSKNIFLFLMLFYCFSLAQGKRNYNYHPLSGKVVFSSEFGFTHSYTDYTYPQPKLLSRGTIEFYLPVKSSNALGLKITTGLGELNSYGRDDREKFNNPTFNTSIFFLGTGINYVKKIGYSFPYISATISHLRVNPKDNEGNLLPNNFNRKYDLNLTMYTAELGIRFLIRDFWSVNMGINYNITNSDFIDDLKVDEQNDKFISLFFGLSFYYAGVANNDSDNDGIVDSKDICPNTPKGTIVDEFGCAKDGEKNKKLVTNKKVVKKKEVKKKQNKKIDTAIDKLTVLQKDSDMDGVPDYLDNCPKTALGVKVNSFGCKIITKVKKENTEEVKNKKGSLERKKTKFKKVKSSYQYSNEKTLPELFFTDGKLYCFQVGTFKTFESAEKLRNKLQKLGYHSIIVNPSFYKIKKKLFTVRIGYFKSLQGAKKYKLSFSKRSK